MQYTNESYIEKLKEINSNIITMEPYTRSIDRIKHKCLVCNREWSPKPCYILNSNTGCPKCAYTVLRAEKFTQSSLDYIQLLLVAKKGRIELVGDYKNNKTRTSHKCLDCGNVWDVRPDSLLYGNGGCSSCIMSKGEKEIAYYLVSNKVDFKQQVRFKDCRLKKPLPFDFGIYLDAVLIALIEYDGEQHSMVKECFGGVEEFRLIQLRDEAKTAYCILNNIRLIRISYKEINDISYILSVAIKNAIAKEA